MGTFALRGLCLALLLVPALGLAADNYTRVRHPDGSHSHFVANDKTVRGGRLSPAQVASVQRSLDGVGGGAQTVSQTLTVARPAVSTVVQPRFTVTPAMARTALRTGLRLNPYLFVGSLAVEGVLTYHDYSFQPGIGLSKPMPLGSPLPLTGGFSSSGHDGNSGPFDTAHVACSFTSGCVSYGACFPVPRSGYSDRGYCATSSGSLYGTWTRFLPCLAGTVVGPIGCYGDVTGLYDPVTSDEIDQMDLSGFRPSLKDLVDLSQWFDPMVSIDPIPTVEHPPKVSTRTDAQTGDVIVTEESMHHSFAVDNSTQPITITVTENITTNEYKNGTLISTTNTTVSSDPAVETADDPIDCEFQPTLCEWLEWTQEDLGMEDPDLSVLIVDQDDFEKSYSIDFGAASCPVPTEINIALIGRSVGVSWQPFCDLMEILKFFVLASAYLYAIYITLGVVRRG